MAPKLQDLEGSDLTIGPKTRVSFVGTAIIALLAGLTAGVWSASAAFWKLNATVDKKLTRSEFTRWTIDAFNAGVKVPIYVAPKEQDETDGGGR